MHKLFFIVSIILLCNVSCNDSDRIELGFDETPYIKIQQNQFKSLTMIDEDKLGEQTGD